MKLVTGIGVDVIEVSRIKKALTRKGFSERVFTEIERDYCESKSNPFPHYSARFAAKESVAKALEVGKPRWQEIEIMGSESGKPVVKFYEVTERLVESRNVAIELSISHTREIAMAGAIAISRAIR